MNTNKYVEAQETKGERLLRKFNDYTNWFVDIHSNNDENPYAPIDYLCIDKKGRKCHVEVKERKGRIEDYKDIFVDVNKLKAWNDIIESGGTLDEQRLYFNFVNDGVIVHDMNHQEEFKCYPIHKQVNYAKGSIETRDKYGLYTKNALLYKYTSNGIKQIKNEYYYKQTKNKKL